MLKINQLNFGYKNQEKLFSNLDLLVESGGICGLLGKNGAGKTTLLKIISGLIFPQQGDCSVLNYVPKQRKPQFLEEIYFLPEDIYLPALTVVEYINCYAKFYPKFDYLLLDKYINEFGLEKNKLLTTLSHGQKKKFLLAFGFATNCTIMILDEPTNGLDIPSKAEFRKLLVETTTDDKLIIISTHQVHDVENIIDSIIILDEGNIILHETLANINSKLSFSYVQEEPNRYSSLYYEKRLGGYVSIMENSNEQDTPIDLEVLFNAVLLNKNKIQHIFGSEK
ncbi:MAG: ABC transporter ATP-binding protein [Gammaproteobacteria bacterium]|nr:ABC transporter ATP-binding protein [Gammaproteobacteria bacterium]